jgi:Ca-activated chloride channel family protein
MVKAILTAVLFASTALAQSSSDAPSSIHRSKDVDSSLNLSQVTETEVVSSEAGSLEASPLLGNVVRSAPAQVPTIRKEVQEVSLALTVTDHHHHFVRNLAPSDFTILDNGEPPERITYFESQSELPLRLAIVIDTSDSVTYAFDDEKDSATYFLQRILRRTSDMALVIGFNQEVRIVQELASDHKLLSHAIRKLPSGGDTAIYDAVSAATQQLAGFGDTERVRRAVILMTDGEDNTSHIGLKEAEEDAQRNECAVYVMSINLDGDRDREQADRAMMELSEVTGGSFLRARDKDGVTNAFSDIDKELRNQYLLSYKPASVTPDGSFHQLFVSGHKEHRIHHRDGYFAR